MKDPYEVLGVRKNASMDEIKEAYKELIKKYHPDKYQNNPLADLAQEKLKEINEAYDYLCKNAGGSGYTNAGSSGSYSSAGNSGSYSQSSGNQSSQYNAVRSYIDVGNLDSAATILRNCQERDAEWYFLSGMIAYRRGWYDEARNMVQQASNMDPMNLEYRRNLAAMQGGGFNRNPYSYGRGGATQGDVSDAFCKALQAYICLDCLCDCF